MALGWQRGSPVRESPSFLTLLPPSHLQPPICRPSFAYNDRKGGEIHSYVASLASRRNFISTDVAFFAFQQLPLA